MNPKLRTYCTKCGSANVRLPENGSDESLVLCGDCGEPSGSLADLKARFAEQAFSPEWRARDALRRIRRFKRD